MELFWSIIFVLLYLAADLQLALFTTVLLVVSDEMLTVRKHNTCDVQTSSYRMLLSNK